MVTANQGDHCTVRDLDLARKAAASYGQFNGWPAWRIAEFETHYANHCEVHGLEYVELVGRPFAAKHNLPIVR